MTPGARAVAGTSSSAKCVITLDPGAASLTLGASSNLSMGCGISDGGSLSIDSSAYITGSPTDVTGSCYGTGGGCAHVDQLYLNAPAPTDPLYPLAAPSDPGWASTSTGPT